MRGTCHERDVFCYPSSMTDAKEGPEDREAKFGGPPPARTIEQRWVLATQGVLVELNTTSHLRVGGEPRPSHSGLSAYRLRQHWGVRSSKEARRCVQWLLDEGHRFGFARDTERLPDEFLGWDLVRASCVAGWAHVAYHLELGEAWEAMTKVARDLRARFASWSDVGSSYAAGKTLWSGAPSADVTEAVALLTAAGGGWDLPWDIDLTGDIPPPAADLLPELVVDPSGANGAFTTIGDALQSSKAPKRVRVHAGVYDESLRIHAPVELLAEGEVIVRNGKGAPLVIDHHAFVRGFRLEASHDEEGTKMQAVWVGDNFARIADCTMETERCGVYAGKKRTEVIVERCTVKAPGIHGLLIEGGAHMTVLDCVVDDALGSGVVTQGDGELYVEGLRVLGAATPALTFSGDNTIELHDVTVERCAAHGMQVLGGSVVRAFDLRLVDNGGVGALFSSTSHAPSEIHGGVLTHNASNDLGVLMGGASVQAVKLGGGPGCAVCVQNEGRLQLEGCEIAPTVHPSLWLMGSSLTVLIDCKVRNDGELAVFADKGTSVRLVGCDIETQVKPAVVLRGVEAALVLGGRIASEGGCLHADEGSRVDAHDVTLISTGRGSDVSAALAVIGEADLAFVGGRIEAAGPRAVLVESGARASLTGTTVAAPAGAAFSVDGGEARLLRVEVAAQEAASVEGEGKLWAEPLEAFGGSDQVLALGLDAPAFAPFEVALVHHGRAALEIEMDALRPAFAPLGAEPDPELCGAWLGLALASLKLATGFEIGRRGERTAVESDDYGDLRKIAVRLTALLANATELGQLAKKLEEQLAAESDQEGDGDEDGEEDHDDGHDHDA